MSARVIKRLLRKCFFKYWKSLSNYRHAGCSHSACHIFSGTIYPAQNGVFMVKKYQLISTQNSCSYIIHRAAGAIQITGHVLHVLQMCELELSFKSIWCQPNTPIDRVCVFLDRKWTSLPIFFLHKKDVKVPTVYISRVCNIYMAEIFLFKLARGRPISGFRLWSKSNNPHCKWIRRNLETKNIRPN